MSIIKTLRRLAITAALLFVPAQAYALAVGFVDASALNVRTGPGSSYERIAALPGGTQVTIHGYTRGGSWCDISTRGLRGWVFCDYVDVEADVVGRANTWGPALGVPIVVFSVDDYWGRHYRDRPWYRDRDRPRRVHDSSRDWFDRDPPRRSDTRRRGHRSNSPVDRMLRAKELNENRTNCQLVGGKIRCDD